MSEKVVLKRQVYLSVEQYNTLKSTGSLTVDGKTIEFSENDEYITPDTTEADITAVRQDVLKEVQKKADKSYVDEQVENVGGSKLYHHFIAFSGSAGEYVEISFLSRRNTEYTGADLVAEFMAYLRMEPCRFKFDIGAPEKQGLLWYYDGTLIITVNGEETMYEIPEDYVMYDFYQEI